MGDQDLSGVNWVDRAKALVPVINEAAGRIDTERRIPPEIMSAMHDAELFRMCLPASMGGGEASLLTIMETVEEIASADASTAWCFGQGLGCSRTAAFVKPEIAREVFGPPNSILAWGPPNGPIRVVAVEGGYRVTGKWKFVSGVRNATWLGPFCPVFNADGSPSLNEKGHQIRRNMLFPASSANISDVWRVIGLKGTGSDNFDVEDLFVPEAFSFVRDSAEDRREAGQLYHITLTTFYGVAFAAVAMGIARTALESFVALAATKKPNHSTMVLRDNPAVQREFAQAEANLGSARSYLVDRLSTVWDSNEMPDSWSLDDRARLRISCTNAILQARAAVAFAYQSAGSDAILEANPFEQRFRDINAVAQQAQGQPTNFEHAGSALLGVEQMGGRV